MFADGREGAQGSSEPRRRHGQPRRRPRPVQVGNMINVNIDSSLCVFNEADRMDRIYSFNLEYITPDTKSQQMTETKYLKSALKFI